MSPLRLMLAALAFLAGWPAGCSRPPEVPGSAFGSPIRHVVVVVIDAAQAGQLGCYGGPPAVSPRIDALAAGGVRAAWAFSNATWTLPSTVSLMTGLLPERHGVVLGEHSLPAGGPPTLAEIARAAGFDTAAYSQMIFASERHGLARGFDAFHYYGPGDGERRAELQAALRERFAALGAAGSLTYVHFRRPHTPYNPPTAALAPLLEGAPLEDGRADAELAHFADRLRGTLGEDERARLRQLYRGGLRAIDDELGELLPLLRLADDTLLVLTSDHGEGLGEHGEYGHGPWLRPEHVRIPLIVAGPGIGPPGAVLDEPLCTVDLLPTLCELLGWRAPPGDGRSFAAALRGDVRPPADGAARARPVPLSSRRDPSGAAAVGAVWREGAELRFASRVPGEPPRLLALREASADDGEASPAGLERGAPPGQRAPSPLSFPAEPLPAESLPLTVGSLLDALAAWTPSGEAAPAPHLTERDEADLRALGYTR